ncbi:MAG TPA: RNA polymerase sigma factor [Bacteroidota bacterium]|jgi:RNA polymerase sigma-70 factor (ECF subfamily)|nr:RNA polymerase sigma factor [Bacteroidota bacterium]
MLDESTFSSFYDRTKAPFWKYIAAMVHDTALADDIFQESYVRFLQSRIESRNDVQMKSYLYRIASNLAHDHWRKEKHRSSVSPDELEDFSSHNPAGETELRSDIGDALKHLAPQQRSMVWLAYVEEYSHREIAGILKVKEQSVKVLLYRARQKLLEVFKVKGITQELGS